MSSLDYLQLSFYIAEKVVNRFYEIRIDKLRHLKLKKDILLRKNPYLFKAKNISTSEGFIRSALDAFLSSQEETVFGNLMEELAIYVCSLAYRGRKAEQRTMKSVDLEFIRDGIYYVVGIKSGVYWGNKDQIDRMKTNFKDAKNTLKLKGISLPIVAVNGCIYGKDKKPLKTDSGDPDLSYYKYCGQEFWELISGDPDLYITIIKPLDVEAKKRDATFQEVYAAKVNEMTLEFSTEFLTGGLIDWERLIEYVSRKNSTQASFLVA